MSDLPPSSDPSQPFGAGSPLGGPPPPADDPTTSTGPGWKSWVVAGGVAAASAVETEAGDQLQPSDGAGPGFGGGTSGTVEAVDGDTISVRDDSDELVEVTATSETEVVEVVEGSVEDLAVGDNVLVVGEADDDGVVAASSITDSGDQAATVGGPGGGFTPPEGMELPEGGGPPEGMSIPEGMSLPEGMEPPDGAGSGGPGAFTPPTAGEITAIDGSTVTVETAEGDAVTVTVDEATTVTVSSAIAVADLAEGDAVVVVGETSDGVVSALSIRAGDPDLLASGLGGRPGGPGGPGQPAGDTATTTD